MWDPDDLVVAPATVAGPGLRAIVRLAGDGLDRLLGTLLEFPEPPPPRPALLAAVLHPDGLGREWGTLEAGILRWPGPGGPIGAALAEVQLPCSPPLVEAFLAEACRHGARPARGGEFTLRAFLAGRVDLLQAEAVLAVVDARSPAELTLALDRLAGGAGREVAALRDAALDLAADLAAAIDFPEEHGTGAAGAPSFWDGVARRLGLLAAAVAAAEARLAARGMQLSGQVPRVVICGPANIGKSSLFNALSGREAALVADAAGTTRDWLEARCTAAADGGQVEWILVDTAGVGAGPTPGGGPAAEAQARAAEETLRASVVVLCRDAADEAGAPSPPPPPGGPVVRVRTRADRGGAETPAGTIDTSVRDGRGIEALRAALAAAVASLPRWDGAGARLAAALARCAEEIEAGERIAARAREGGEGEEAVVAAALERAIEALDGVTGAGIGTDLLDRIFSRHCIGK
jgi:tRNA modification GTPase